MDLLLLRHGQTSGNLRRAYVGSTDEPLCDEGVRCAEDHAKRLGAACPSDPFSLLGSRPFEPEAVFSSPMKRAIQTARIFFPERKPRIVDELREMDFGVFEGKNYKDMQGDSLYQEWVDGMCEGICPGGEGKQGFIERTCVAFLELVRECDAAGAKSVALVAHGGTLMAVLSEFVAPDEAGGKSYYGWHVKNCEGYFVRACEVNGSVLLSDVRPFPSR